MVRIFGNLVVSVAAAVTLLSSLASAQTYTLVDNWSGNNFFGNFQFFTAGDPTHGFVQYVSQATAQSNNLLSVSNGAVYIYSDHTNVASSAGRMSVRLTSNKVYNVGTLFVFDLNHMPYGCGTWPAIWTVGPNWPNGGEIDIIEGVNQNTLNSMTLHTSAGCNVAGVARNMTGASQTTDCYISDPNQSNNAGCGVQDSSTYSYGQGFNSNGGGVYAALWTTSGIKIWFFRRNAIPADLTNNTPNPLGWHVPDADFPSTNCPSSYFTQQQIVLDNTFCGDWAGNVFAQSGCSGSCNTYVQNNPSAFTEAYWSINYFKTFSVSGSSPPPPPPTTTTTTTTTSTSSGGNTCNGQYYDPNNYVCDGTQLCPKVAPLACGGACYSSSQYKCCNGNLAQLTQSC